MSNLLGFSISEVEHTDVQRSPGVPMGGGSCYGIKVIVYIKLECWMTHQSIWLLTLMTDSKAKDSGMNLGEY